MFVMDKLGIAKRAFRRVTARRKPAVLLVLLVFAFVLSYGLFAQKSHSIEQKNVKPDFNWNVSNKLDEQVKLDVSESKDTSSISKNLLEQPFLEDTEGRKPHDIKNEKNEKNIDESDMKQESIQTSQSEKIDDNKNGNELDQESTESEIQETKGMQSRLML
ncbi:hypothetical protein HDV02_006078 [Globomyces sp. JEL0801]|nr:hypothetical protein HDV02_006078 [Globomyces sp. JEL0801]